MLPHQHSLAAVKVFAITLIAVFSCSLLLAQNGSQIYKPVVGSTASNAQLKGGAVFSTSTFSPMSALTDGDLTNYASNTELLTALSADGVTVYSTTTFPAFARRKQSYHYQQHHGCA